MIAMVERVKTEKDMEMTSALSKLQEQHDKILQQRDETISELRKNNELMRARMKSEVQQITRETEKQVQKVHTAAKVNVTVEREIHQREMKKALEEQRAKLMKENQKEITKLKAEHLFNHPAEGVLSLVARTNTGRVRDVAYNMIASGELLTSPLKKAKARGRALGYEDLVKDERGKKKIRKDSAKPPVGEDEEQEQKSATASSLFQQMLLQSEL